MVYYALEEEEKMAEKIDINDPILILVRRGRKGRGFSVAPIEDVSNAAACADEKEVGEVIKEMLDDENQPRVNINNLLSAGAPASGAVANSESDDDDEYEDEDDAEDEDPHKGGLFEGVAAAGEGGTERLIMNGLGILAQKGRDMSSKRVRRSRGSRTRKRKKT